MWRVTLAGLTSSPSTFSTSYTPPSLTTLGSPVVSLETTGGTIVTLNGADFGAIGATTVSGNYSGGSTNLNFQAGCVVTVAHTQMQCTTVPGVGSG